MSKVHIICRLTTVENSLPTHVAVELYSKNASHGSYVIKENLCPSLPVVRRGPGEEAQAPSRRVLLHPDLPDCRGPQKDAAHRPQHVHSWRPGAHLPRQDTLQSGKMTEKWFWILFQCHWKLWIWGKERTTSRSAGVRTQPVNQTCSLAAFLTQSLSHTLYLLMMWTKLGLRVSVGISATYIYLNVVWRQFSHPVEIEILTTFSIFYNTYNIKQTSENGSLNLNLVLLIYSFCFRCCHLWFVLVRLLKNEL